MYEDQLFVQRVLTPDLPRGPDRVNPIGEGLTWLRWYMSGIYVSPEVRKPATQIENAHIRPLHNGLPQQ